MMEKAIFIFLLTFNLVNTCIAQITGKEKLTETNYIQTYPENNSYNSNWRDNYISEVNDIRKAAKMEVYRFESLVDEFQFISKNFYQNHPKQITFCYEQRAFFDSYYEKATTDRNNWINAHEYLSWDFVYLLRRNNDNLARAINTCKKRMEEREKILLRTDVNNGSNPLPKQDNVVKMISNELFVYDPSEKRYTYKSIILINSDKKTITIYDDGTEIVFDIIGIPNSEINTSAFTVLDTQGNKLVMTYECGIFYFTFDNIEYQYTIEDDCSK